MWLTASSKEERLVFLLSQTAVKRAPLIFPVTASGRQQVSIRAVRAWSLSASIRPLPPSKSLSRVVRRCSDVTSIANAAGNSPTREPQAVAHRQYVPVLQALIPSTTVAGILYYLGATRNSEFFKYFSLQSDGLNNIGQTPIQTMTQSVDVLISIALVLVGVVVAFAIASAISRALLTDSLPLRTRKLIAKTAVALYAALVGGLLIYGSEGASKYAPLAIPACGGVTAAICIVALKAAARSARLSLLIGYMDATGIKLIRIAAWTVLAVALVTSMRNYAAYIGRADAESIGQKPCLLGAVTLHSKESLEIPGGTLEPSSTSTPPTAPPSPTRDKSPEAVSYVYPGYRKLAEAGDIWYLISIKWTPGGTIHQIKSSPVLGVDHLRDCN